MGAKTKSGTPVETRGATEKIGSSIEGLFTDAAGNPIGIPQIISLLAQQQGRLGAASAQNLLGFSPQMLSLGAGIKSLTSPAEQQTSDLFRALIPFEQRTRDLGTAQINEQFGAAGGRFGRNIGDAQARFLADTNMNQLLARAQALDAARGRQIQGTDLAIRGLLGASSQDQQATLALLGQLLGFASPSGAVITPGLAGSLLGAASNVGAAAAL